MANRIRIALTVAALLSLATALSCGKFFISAHSLAAISISPATPAITLQSTSGSASTQQFTATGTFGDLSNKDISSTAIWTSSSPTVATIDDKGLATAVNLGTTTIKASSANLSASTTLTVSNTVTSSIAIACGAGSIGCTTSGANLTSGSTVALVATATLSDKTTKDVTSTATWSSSNTAVASVNNIGQVTALSPGSANITATFQGVTSPAFSVSVIF
jgi:uncharacterized protein YjdB